MGSEGDIERASSAAGTSSLIGTAGGCCGWSGSAAVAANSAAAGAVAVVIVVSAGVSSVGCAGPAASVCFSALLDISISESCTVVDGSPVAGFVWMSAGSAILGFIDGFL